MAFVVVEPVTEKGELISVIVTKGNFSAEFRKINGKVRAVATVDNDKQIGFCQIPKFHLVLEQTYFFRQTGECQIFGNPTNGILGR